jgi:hypothetical protein
MPTNANKHTLPISKFHVAEQTLLLSIRIPDEAVHASLLSLASKGCRLGVVSIYKCYILNPLGAWYAQLGGFQMLHRYCADGNSRTLRLRRSQATTRRMQPFV